MSERFDTTVLIIGAGPVGLTLAMDLKSRGVDVTIIESRARNEPPSARCNTVASRTMEIWRQLGVADSVRASGMPDDFFADVVWMTRLTGHEIARMKLPCRADRFTNSSYADANWPTAEPVHRASQWAFDPILYDHAVNAWGVKIVNEAEFTGYVQDDAGVTATVLPRNAESYSVRSRFLVGCDGGRSKIRKAIGSQFHGDSEIFRSRSSLIRAPWMRKQIGRPAWTIWALGPGTIGTVLAINGTDLWLVHVILPYGEKDFEAVDVDRGIRDLTQMPQGASYEVLQRENWVARRFIADKFRDRNVFICGDAAHIWVPFAGHGMNCGVADAANLSSHLAAYLNGWGGEALLDCYQIERQPITEQVSHHVMKKAMEYVEGSVRNTAPPELDHDDETGRRMRAALGKKLLDINIPQYSCSGLNYGAYYDQSPIIIYDGETAPPYGMNSYTPSTVPGCRMPHFFALNGKSIYDLLGKGYTLLRFDPEVDIDGLSGAARERGMPLKILDLANPDPAVFHHKLLLVRPDQHNGWRGDAVPANALKLIDTLRGANTESATRSAA